MFLMGRGVPALIVPDEQAWTMWGHDPCSLGMRPASHPDEPLSLMVPGRVPNPLVRAAIELRRSLPENLATVVLPAYALEGVAINDVLAAARVVPAGDVPGTANPTLGAATPRLREVTLGPIGHGLPGGLTVRAWLDGEVVSRCEVEATLTIEERPARPFAPPDPVATTAWSVALMTAAEHAAGAEVPESARLLRVASIELERAVSHLAWLRAFARVMRFARLVELASGAVGKVARARLGVPTPGVPDGTDLARVLPDLDRALAATRTLERWVMGSRGLRARTEGRAAVDMARAAPARGPTARAAGCEDDARAYDPLYERLGFTAQTCADGDALARTLLRVAEAHDGVELARAALIAAEQSPSSLGAPGPPTVVEGPRGPLMVVAAADATVRVEAPGSEKLLELAGDSVVGDPWASAPTTVASFDPSPWRVVA